MNTLSLGLGINDLTSSTFEYRKWETHKCMASGKCLMALKKCFNLYFGPPTIQHMFSVKTGVKWAPGLFLWMMFILPQLLKNVVLCLVSIHCR